MVSITLFLKWNEKLLLEKVDHVTIYDEKTFHFHQMLDITFL